MDEKRRSYLLQEAIPWAYTQSTITHKGSTPALHGLQITKSESHGWPNTAGRADVGGSFQTQKTTLHNFNSPIVNSWPRRGDQYSGPIWPANVFKIVEANNSLFLPDTAQLDRKGATAIAKTIPTNSASDVATFLGELKAGLPKMVGASLFKSKFKDYRKIGDEYLNIEFGWKPLISDLQKFGDAAIQSDKIVKQLHRDSGKVIRRKFSFPDEENVTTQSYMAYPYVPVNLSTNIMFQRKLTITEHKTVKTWFSGAYTYHVNLGTRLQDKLDRHAAEARRLYGVELTPETVWNLAPWSWIVDWEGNIGDVLHNVSAFAQDGLVLRYGYIMQQTSVVRNYHMEGGSVYGTESIPLNCTISYETKVRQRATPFGFGFDLSSLTGRQSAILGALGLSNGPKR